MTPEQFGQYIRDDIAQVVEARQGTQHRDHRLTTEDAARDLHGAQHARSRRTPNAPPVTRILADFVATHPSQGWDAGVEREAHRTLLNWVGCAIGASRHADASRRRSPRCGSSRPARRRRSSGAASASTWRSAALLNGITSHTFDFDDTHLQHDHPSGRPGRLGGAGARRAHAARAGAQLVDALVLGIDVACRVGNAIYPDHYDRGWHITGSTGMLGAAAACARLLGLDARRTAMALGIAASQPIGVREQFGIDDQAVPRRRRGARRADVGADGAARLHRVGPRARGAARPAADVLDQVRLARDHRRARPALRDLVQHLQAVRLRHRHPSQHRRLRAAARRARPRAPSDIERIELKVHPLVLELTGKTAPRTGLEGKFSVYHACAAGILFGQAGEAEFSDAIVARADVIALRDRVRATRRRRPSARRRPT